MHTGSNVSHHATCKHPLYVHETFATGPIDKKASHFCLKGTSVKNFRLTILDNEDEDSWS